MSVNAALRPFSGTNLLNLGVKFFTFFFLNPPPPPTAANYTVMRVNRKKLKSTTSGEKLVSGEGEQDKHSWISLNPSSQIYSSNIQALPMNIVVNVTELNKTKYEI